MAARRCEAPTARRDRCSGRSMDRTAVRFVGCGYRDIFRRGRRAHRRVGIRLATSVSVLTFLRSTVSVMPYDFAYGLGAAGFSVFAKIGGAPYLAMWLPPAVSVQGFLVLP